MAQTPRNQLDEAASLYLQQHADNPVHWWPWSEAALAAARRHDKPILLSIGYSACHWCHVMAHESFEDEATAAVMNRHFVNIKVDREERPDLDQIYQLSHQLLTGRGGGWPLTAILEPESLTPFFAGTYFPPEPRHGLPAFADLLDRIADYFQNNRDELTEQNAQLAHAIRSINRPRGESTSVPGPETIDAANRAYISAYDSRHGGLGQAPKFPQAPALAWLSCQTQPAAEVRTVLTHTLNSLAAGGCYDHLGGGFFRYCVDGHWGIPHFEKMLYDNALLLPILAKQAASNPQQADLWRRACEGTADWLKREMQDSEGGFYASIDADSEEGEGAFYVWTPEEVEEHIGADRYPSFSAAYGLDQPPNFEGEFWHLDRRRSQTHPPADWQPATLSEQDQAAGRQLLELRSQRPVPTTDTKIIAHWNGLTVAGLARAGRDLNRAGWVATANHSLKALKQRLWDGDRLWRLKPANHPAVAATLDDYAAMLHACAALAQHPDSGQWLQWARDLGEKMLADFTDTEHGGFFLTAHGQDMPISRLKPMQDDATPAGNGLACQSLLVLGHLMGESRWLDAAEDILTLTGGDIQRSPRGHATLLRALLEWHQPRPSVVLFGTETDIDQWRQVCNQNAARLFPVGDNPADLPGILANYAFDSYKASAQAYLCLASRCLPAVNHPDDLSEQFKRL